MPDRPATTADIAALRQDVANLGAALNAIARGMGNLVTIYESWHVRQTGETVEYPREEADDPGYFG